MDARTLLLGLLCLSASASAAPPAEGSIEARFAPPEGFARVKATPGSFAEWLRRLTLKPGRSQVHLYDGLLKRNQEAHLAVLDMEIGHEDLQQCADAVIRLRAEYLWSAKREADLRFRFTSGDQVPWTRWKGGERPDVGRRVSWVPQRTDASRESFRRWLDAIFRYAGTLSLARDLKSVPLSELRPGDVFVKGGSPGHAVIVLDVAQAVDGRRVMMLGQSYMPAQEIQVLRSFDDATSPWVPVTGTDPLLTPEWKFGWKDLKRFPENACQAGR